MNINSISLRCSRCGLAMKGKFYLYNISCTFYFQSLNVAALNVCHDGMSRTLFKGLNAIKTRYTLHINVHYVIWWSGNIRHQNKPTLCRGRRGNKNPSWHLNVQNPPSLRSCWFSSLLPTGNKSNNYKLDRIIPNKSNFLYAEKTLLLFNSHIEVFLLRRLQARLLHRETGY